LLIGTDAIPAKELFIYLEWGN